MTDALRAVLFDAVGTLIELREPVGETYARFALDAGTRIPASRLEEAFGRVLAAAPDNVHPSLADRKRPSAERAWWRSRVRETFRAADQAARIDDFDGLFGSLYEHYAGAGAWVERKGAAAALAELASRPLQIAVVSNFDLRLPGLLSALGLDGPLEAVVLPAHVGVAKPDARIFERALQRLGVRAENAVYVGDSPERDLAGAARAGLRSVDVAELATLRELPAHLDALFPETS